MLGIIFGVIVSVIAIFFVIGISVKELNDIKQRKFICENCEKEFSPKVSASSLFNFGDNSKVVKCPYCDYRSRMSNHKENEYDRKR